MAASAVRALDLIGTLAFAISGAIRLDMLSGIGGGIARDLLVAEMPNVLQREFSAVAALLGAACVVGGDALGLPATPTAVAGALLCFVLRYLAICRNWQLPVARADQDGCPGRDAQVGSTTTVALAYGDDCAYQLFTPGWSRTASCTAVSFG